MRSNRKTKSAAKSEYACQILVVLSKTDPLVWRRLQVPDWYSFWDLHVAIQDAMGWKDCHLHEFVLVDQKWGRPLRVGIPGDEMPEDRPCLPGWKVPMARHLRYGCDPVRYRYDFGDEWEHIVEFEGVEPSDQSGYPRCVAGAGACPPEDVGGAHGYAEFLQAMRDTKHPEHRAMSEWVGGSFDPNVFDPRQVTFDDPLVRWNNAFGGRNGAV